MIQTIWQFQQYHHIIQYLTTSKVLFEIKKHKARRVIFEHTKKQIISDLYQGRLRGVIRAETGLFFVDKIVLL